MPRPGTYFANLVGRCQVVHVNTTAATVYFAPAVVSMGMCSVALDVFETAYIAYFIDAKLDLFYK